MKTPKQNKKSGAILVIVMVILVTFTLFVSALLQLSGFNAQETERQIRESQAFWIAEEGVQQKRLNLSVGNDDYIPETDATQPFDSDSGRSATYEVRGNATSGFTSIGRLTVGEVIITNRILFKTESIYEGFGDAFSAPAITGDPWAFVLGGTGDPVSSGGTDPIGRDWDTYREVGGADEVYGNITTGDGAVYLGGGTAGNNDGSSVNPAPFPNTYGFDGDVNTSGEDITVVDGARIYGNQNNNAEPRPAPNLIAMDYPNTATHNLTEIFEDAGGGNTLPPDHELYDVVKREWDDGKYHYYFEPSANSYSGGRQDLSLGDDRVYYAEGDVWFDRGGPRQFDIDGTATIVASGDIHIGDSLQYVDEGVGGDLLALVALGTYYADDTYKDGGDIYFGDARGNGTLYGVDAFMFAAHDFYYNFYYQGNPDEPKTGFTVFGNFLALNQIHVYRDWYNVLNENSRGNLSIGEAHPAVFNVSANQWEDAITGDPLIPEQVTGGTYEYTNNNGRKRKITIPLEKAMRHYRMIAKYDERIYDPETRLSGLPTSGSGGAGGKLTHWEHADADDS